ncbi:MAG: anthranilate synthase component II, partial [Caulobacteraceae bacterium]
AAGAKAVVLSPGPCTPNEAGFCLELIGKAPEPLPILGVCLGHQAIGQAFGGKVGGAKDILHGKTSPIRHAGAGIFEGAPDGFSAARYHSLAVERESLPEALTVTAWTGDGEIMGLAHKERPVFGVQFHPESHASEQGKTLLNNFLKLI